MRNALAVTLVLALLKTSSFALQDQGLQNHVSQNQASQNQGSQNQPQSILPQLAPIDAPVKPVADQTPARVPAAETVALKKGTPVCMFPSQNISSRTAHLNGRVSFRVGLDVSAAGATLIPAGTQVWATISEVRRPDIGGKDGKVSFAFDAVPLLNGKTVPLQPLAPRSVVHPVKPKRQVGRAIKEALDDPYIIFWPLAVPFMALIPFEKGQEAAIGQYQCLPEETAEDIVLKKEEVIGLSRAPIPQIEEELIADTEGAILNSWTDGPTKPLLWIEERPGKKQTLWLDGKQLGDEYSEIRDVATSKDLQQIAFTARRGSKWVLVVNGKDRTPEFDDMSSPDITAEGRFMVPARKDWKWRVLDNGQAKGPLLKESKWFRNVPLSEVMFDDSGAHYAFVAYRNGKWITLMDGEETGVEMDEVRPTVEKRTIIPAKSDWVGRHYIVAAKINHKWSYVVDGQPGTPFDIISKIESTPDGKHYAYAGATGPPDGYVTGSVVVDGKTVATYAGIGLGKDLYPGVSNLRPEQHGVSGPKLLDDGTAVYAFRRGISDVVVLWNGVPGPSFEDIHQITVTADGKHVFYLGTRDHSGLVVHDQAIMRSLSGDHNLSVKESEDLIQISDDGARLAYLLTAVFASEKSVGGLTDTIRVVVDDKSDPEFQFSNREHSPTALNFHFNADGKHYFYEVHTFRRTRCWGTNNCPGDYQRFLVVDGAPLGLYLDVLPGAKWSDPHTVQFLALQGKQLLRVTYRLED